MRFTGSCKSFQKEGCHAAKRKNRLHFRPKLFHETGYQEVNPGRYGCRPVEFFAW